MNILKASDCYAESLEGVEQLVAGKTFMFPIEKLLFTQLMKEKRPKKILEIGTHIGGTTAVILNTMETLGLAKEGTQLHSMDLALMEEKMKETIENSLSVVTPDWHRDNWHIHCGHTVAHFVEEIGEGIDFCIIDAMHMPPGELLDFIAVLPFLTDGAIVVLHDIGYARVGVQKCCTATNLLFSTVTAENKYMMRLDPNTEVLPRINLDEYLNIGAFEVNQDTRKYCENVMQALSLPWEYFLDDAHFEEFRVLVEKKYPQSYEHFLSSAKRGRRAGSFVNKSETLHKELDYDRMLQLLLDYGTYSIKEIAQRKIVLWGIGDDFEIPYFLLAGGCYLNEKIRMPHTNSGLLSLYRLIFDHLMVVDSNHFGGDFCQHPDALKVLGDDLAAVLITPENPIFQEEIKATLSEMGIDDKKVYLLSDFFLPPKTSLNYPTGVV